MAQLQSTSISGSLTLGYPNENIDRSLVIYSSNVSNKYGRIISENGNFIIDYSISNQNLLFGRSTAQWQLIRHYGQAHQFNVDGSEVVRIDSNGRLGIGTTTPSEELHVVGEAIIEGPTYSMSFLGGSDLRGSNQLLVRADGSYLRLASVNNNIYYQAGASHIFQDASQNDIVTINQDGRLDVASDIRLRGSSAASNLGVVRMFVGSDDTLTINPANDGVSQFKFQANGDLIVPGAITAQEFHTEFVSASIIYQSGSTKFGDTSDDIHSFTGSISLNTNNQNYYISGSDSILRIGSKTTANKIQLELYHAANPVSLGINYNGGQALPYIESVHPSYDTNTHLLFKPGGTETWRIGAHGTDHAYGSAFSIKPANSSLDFYLANSSGTPILYSDTSTGNIGIGTTLPDGRLNIRAAYTSSASITNDASDYAITVDFIGTNGSVASPQYGAHFAIRDSNGAAVAAINGVDQGGAGTTGLSFLTGDVNGLSDRLHITNAGNVGIGTNAPLYTLDVRGGARVGGVNGDVDFIIEADADNTGEDDNPRLILRQDGGLINGYIGLNGSINTAFTDAAANGMYINSDGDFQIAQAGELVSTFSRVSGDKRVGIGTASPETNLHVKKTIAGTSGSLVRLEGYVDGDLTTQSIFQEFVLRDTNSNEYPQVKIGAVVGQNGNADSQEKEGSGAFVVYTNNADSVTDGNPGASLAERMRVDYQGNVGIGTTTPATNLDISSATGAVLRLGTSDTSVLDGDTIGRIEFFSSDATNTNSGLGAFIDLVADGSQDHFNPNGDLRFGTSYASAQNATTRMTIKGNGNVGIGTTAPNYKLEVKGTSGTLSDSNQIFSVGNTTGGTQLAFGSLENSYNWIRSYESGAGGRDLVIGTNAEMIRLTAGGNVGISTTTPQRVLDVRLPNSTAIGASIAGQISVGNYQGLHFGYSESGNNLYRKSAIVFERTDLTSNNAQGKVHILNGPQAGSASATLADAKLTIGESGNVGIGVTSPSHSLHVSGAADVMLIEGSGSTANTSIFAIDGNNGRLFEVSDDLSDSLFSVNTIAGLPVMEVFADNTVTMGAFNQNDLVITGSKVGIGTSTPQYNLQVIGDASVSTWLYVDNIYPLSSTRDLLLNTGAGRTITLNPTSTGKTVIPNGNVGIGTTSPTVPLEVKNGDTSQIISDRAGNGTNIVLKRSGVTRGVLATSDVSGREFELYSSSDLVLNASTGNNVGINTFSPAETLHVSGSVRVDGSIGSSPSTQSAATLATAYGEDATEYLAQPSLWLKIVIDGTDYVIPAYASV